MSEVGNEDAGGVLARLMRGANLRRSVEVLKAPDESLAATVSALANTAGGWILIGPDPEDGWRSAVGFDAEAAVEALRGALGAVEPEVRAEAGIASVDGRPSPGCACMRSTAGAGPPACRARAVRAPF